MSSIPAPNPNVPQVPTPLATLGALLVTCRGLKQGMDSLAGYSGSSLDRAVTFNDLISLKVLTRGAALSATGTATGASSSSSSTSSVVNPYVVSGFFGADTLSSGQVLLVHQFTAQVVFPANFDAIGISMASFGGALIAPAADASVLIQRCAAAADPTVSGNWSTVGTVSFASGAPRASLATTGAVAVVFYESDFMRWVGPTPADASLAQLFLTLVATR